MRRLAAAVVLVLALAGCGVDNVGQPTDRDGADRSVKGSVQVIVVDGVEREYVCFRYTTANRGGLWCERTH